jgi:hypothetical protein
MSRCYYQYYEEACSVRWHLLPNDMLNDVLLTTDGNDRAVIFQTGGNKLQFHKNYDGVRTTSLLSPYWKQTAICHLRIW